MGMVAFVGGVSCGAALTFFLDPDEGRRRRALLGDQLTHLAMLAKREAPKRSRHLANQVQGVIAETRSHLGEGMQAGNLTVQGFETLGEQAA